MLVVACLFASACAMYGDPAVRLKNPPKGNPPKGWNDPPVATVQYVEDCDVNFSAPPVTKRQTKVAEQKVTAGDNATAQVSKAPEQQAQVTLTLQGLEQYREALIADPYNAEATLKLALAYDKLLRKGCAIAMLKRLDQLSANPKFDADRVKTQVLNNAQWFKPYRTDALKAAGL
jgi:hypothetical protein